MPQLKLKTLIYYIKLWTLSSIIIVPSVLLLLLPLFIYKLIITFIKNHTPFINLKSPLTSYDSIFAVDNFYTNPYAANATLIFLDGHLPLKTLQQNFKSILTSKNQDNSLKFEKLQQIPTSFFGYFFWKDFPNIDVKKHIRKIHDFQLEDDFFEHENSLNLILGELMTSPFPDQCPLWEILILNGFKNGQTVLVFRLHHTLGDGYTFNHIIDNIIQQSSQYIVKQQNRTLLQEASLIANAPALLATLYKEGLASKRNFYTEKKTSSTGLVSMTTFSLSEMKQIRQNTKSHFATVGMSLMTGALRRYHLENHPPSTLPPWVSIMHSLPKPNHPLTKMVNHWGVGLFKIPISIENPKERLIQSEQAFIQYLNEQFHQLIHIHMPLLSLFPKIFLKLFFSTNFGTSMGFTSVPAFEKEATLCGIKILHMNKIFGMQWKQTAVATAVYTHNGVVGYTMFANKDIIPDQKSMDRLVKVYLHDEFKQLANETGIQSQNNIKIDRLSQPFA